MRISKAKEAQGMGNKNEMKKVMCDRMHVFRAVKRPGAGQMFCAPK